MQVAAGWENFTRFGLWDSNLGFGLDISHMAFTESWLDSILPQATRALEQMAALEQGQIANPDENRMVGHYWLRSPVQAPSKKISSEIHEMIVRVQEFSSAVHKGRIRPPGGGKFRHILLIGIGGSALGPQFVARALAGPEDPLDCYFFDNTDPDGMQRVLSAIPDLSKTLCIVVSKSGGTKETRNGMLIAKETWQRRGLEYAKSFVAVTSAGSELDQLASREAWLARFPMWDWVGGRTSELSAVGLLPAALQGFQIDELLRGANDMDFLTRRSEALKNPAMLLALMWHAAGEGRGLRDMVVLPYNDRLELFSRYLQQLVMESIGKEKDLDGQIVHQGLTVYGNKGSTDQHAFVQQLRDGPDNFFVVFIEVLRDLSPKMELPETDKGAHQIEVESGVVSGDYLYGFLRGTQLALCEAGKQSLSITIRKVDEHSVGMLIALFERAVGLYASLIGVNAYHQPGVEAGKRAAGDVLKLQYKLLSYLQTHRLLATAPDIAKALGETANTQTIFFLLRRLAANGRIQGLENPEWWNSRFGPLPG